MPAPDFNPRPASQSLQREIVASAVGKVTQITRLTDPTTGLNRMLLNGRLVKVEFLDIGSNPPLLRGATRYFYYDAVSPALKFKTGDIVAGQWENPRVVKPGGSYGDQAWIEADHTARGPQPTHNKVTLAPLKDAQKLITPQQADQIAKEIGLAHSKKLLSDADAQKALKDLPKELDDGAEERDPLGGAWISAPSPPLAEYLYERGNYADGYIRIGYIAFGTDTPLEDIQIQRDMPFESISTLRSNTPIQKNNWTTNVKVSLTFTFKGLKAINRTLFPLLRLFRRAPFLPVINKHLNNNNITALALASAQVQTVPGFPHALRVILTCWEFQWKPYFPSAESLDDLFCYPLLKLWAEKPRSRGQELSLGMAPFRGDWDGLFNLYHFDRSVLEKLAEDARNEAQTGQKTRQELYNRTIDAFRRSALALLKDVIEGPPDLRLQDQLQENPNLPGFRKINAAEWDLPGDWGVANSSPSVDIPYRPQVFIKIRDASLARLAMNDPEVKIYRDMRWFSSLPYTAGYDRRTGIPRQQLDALDNGTALHFSGREVSQEDLEEFLDGNTRATEQALQAGLYYFVLPPGSPVFRVLSQRKKIGETDPASKTTKGATEKEVERGFTPDFKLPFIADPSDLVVEQVASSVENMLAQLTARGYDTPLFQYLGSTSLYFQVVGLIRETAVPNCTNFFNRTHDIARSFPGRADGTPFGGMIQVRNELFQFLGVDKVLPLTWSTQSIPGQPGWHRFTLTLVEFDDTQRSREALNDLMRGITEQAVQDQNRALSVESLHDSLFVRWLRASEFHKRLQRTELYPDLGLPTHAELHQWVTDMRAERIWDWNKNDGSGAPYPGYEYLSPNNGGSGWQWTLKGPERRNKRGEVVAIPLSPEFMSQLLPDKPQRFADPDFYCAAGQRYWGGNLVSKILTEVDTHLMLKDQWGVQIPLKPGQFLDVQAETEATDPYGILERGKRFAQEGKSGNGVKPYGTGKRTPTDPGPRPAGGPELGGALPQGTGSGLIKPTGAASLPGNDSLESLFQGRGAPSERAKQEAAYPEQTRYQHYINTAIQIAQGYGVDPALVAAVIKTESAWNAWATSKLGAQGLMQLYNHASSEIQYNPVQNMKLGTQFLKQLLERYQKYNTPEDPFRGVKLALMGYNAGPVVADQVAAQGEGYLLNNPKGKKYYETIEFVYGGKDTRLAGTKFALSKRPGILAQWAQYQRDLRVPIPGGTGVATKQQTEGEKAELQREVLDLVQKFQEGWAFHARDIAPFMKNGGSANDRWVEDGWLLNVPRTRTYTSPAAPLQTFNVELSDYYWVQKDTRILVLFVTEWLKRGKKPALVRVPPNDVAYGSSFGTYDANAGNKHLAGPQRPEEVFLNNDTFEDVFHDLRKEFIAGRLLGAFPTFYVAIVDGGRPLRIWRLYDHVYGMQAVVDITVHRDRRNPADTAIVGFANMYGNMTAQTQEMKRVRDFDPRGVWNLAMLDRYISNWVRIDDETVEMWSKHLNSMMLKPGARLHIRLGYGSDANELPVVFNGVITEVPLSEGQVKVVALGDGIELMNDPEPNAAMGSTPVTRENGWWATGVNPRELIMSYLDPNRAPGEALISKVGTALGQGISPIFYYHALNRNKYGIEHFGKPIRDWLKAWDGELGVNVYSPVYTEPVNRSTPWENALGIFSWMPWSKNDKLIGVQISQGKVWDIMDTCRKAVPDYILTPVPMELRSTLFYGKPWFPVYYEYKTKVDQLYQGDLSNDHPSVYFRKKPFQQVHIISSDYNLLQNEVRADATLVKTKCQAIGTYNGWLPGSRDMGAEQSAVQFVDTDIYDEFQKLIVVDCPLYSTMQMKFGAPQSWFMNRAVVDYYAAMHLRDTVKEMYQGPMVILGNGWIKPYDLNLVMDTLSGLNGPCETKTVTHTFSVQTGFITEVVPDCIVSYHDYDGQNLHMWIWTKAQQLLHALSVARMIGHINAAASTKIARNQIRQFIDYLKSEIKNPGQLFKNQALGPRKAELQNIAAEVDAKLRRARTNSVQVYQLLDEIAETNPTYSAVMAELPLPYQAGVETNRQVFHASGKTRQWLVNQWDELDQWAVKKVGDLRKAVDEAQEAVVKARNELGQHDPRDVKAVKTARADGVDIEDLKKAGKIQGDPDRIFQSLLKVEEAEGNLKWARLSARSANVARRGVVGGVNLLRNAASSTVGAFFTMGFLMVLSGNLSEWVYRWSVARQAFVIYPLKIWDNVLEAGINGHRGAVIGDSQGQMDRWISEFAEWMSTPGISQGIIGLVPVLGDLAIAGAHAKQDYERPGLPSVPPP